jgi:hypothetical protein
MAIAMNYSNVPRFDVVEYIKKLRNAGASQQLAEIQAQELEHVLEEAINTSKMDVQSKELATRGNIKELEVKIEQTRLELQKEIAQSSNRIVIWVVSLLSGYGVFFLGILAKGFHWI